MGEILSLAQMFVWLAPVSVYAFLFWLRVGGNDFFTVVKVLVENGLCQGLSDLGRALKCRFGRMGEIQNDLDGVRN